MKMVKTFIKTQHQHVMPPEKEKEKKRKEENAQANEPCPLAERYKPGSQTASELAGGQGKRDQDGVRYEAQHNPSPSCVFL